MWIVKTHKRITASNKGSYREEMKGKHEEIEEQVNKETWKDTKIKNKSPKGKSNRKLKY